MTTATAGKRRSIASAFRGGVRELQTRHSEELQGVHWPSPKYRDDPVGFAREVLGVDPWHRQVEVLEAVRDDMRVAVRSGHKVSKSHTAAIVALWFYCSNADARVVMTSTTARQVDQILWREVRMQRTRAVVTIDGEMGMLARTGLRSADFREIVGFTAREPEAVAGISGGNLLYILDEASGIPDSIFEAIEGNRAGGARVLMFSNPTRTTGEFFNAFHKKAEFYRGIQISSEETPNVTSGKRLIPGLATREWIEEKKQEWGEDSALYKVRVKGEFVLREEGRVIDLHSIAEAEQRWFDPETDATGRLYVGLDPAGEGKEGDETVFAPRRGNKILSLHPHRGLDPAGILLTLLGLLATLRDKREQVPVVVVDAEGAVGARVYGHLRQYADLNPSVFELVGVRGSQWGANKRHDRVYDRIRDELWASLAAWIKQGGAIPEDGLLAAELHAPEWRTDHFNRQKATSKDDIKKQLGRSPDRADAVTLACWMGSESVHRREPEVSEAPRQAELPPLAPEPEPGDPYAQGFDPYAAYWTR